MSGPVTMPHAHEVGGEEQCEQRGDHREKHPQADASRRNTHLANVTVRMTPLVARSAPLPGSRAEFSDQKEPDEHSARECAIGNPDIHCGSLMAWPSARARSASTYQSERFAL